MHTVNGVYVVQGEANAVVALLRKFRHNLMHRTALDDHGTLFLFDHFCMLHIGLENTLWFRSTA